MAVQTTYNENIAAARAGMRADMTPATFISRTVEDEAGIGFGKVVQVGANDGGCTGDLDTTDLTAQRYLGITVRERSVRPESPDEFAEGESARIMTKGAIWVSADAAVTPADIVTVTLASGAIGKTAVGAGVVAIPNAKWETSTTGAGLAKLRLA